MMTVENADHGRPTGRPRNQRERVRQALRCAGDHGITQVDFLLPVTVDGGPPIVPLPARVDELRHAGHHIEHVGRRNRCVISRLVDANTPAIRRDNHAALAGRAPQPGLSPADDQSALFDSAVGTARPRSPYAAQVA